VGTSALVWPAAGLPLTARSHSALLVEVNPEPTELTSQADLSLRGPAGEVLPELVRRIQEG
jgi:NAD-dependent deacetylase